MSLSKESINTSSVIRWRAGTLSRSRRGVLFIINNSIGLITPPVGTVLNVVAGVGRMKMDAVTRGVMPFMVAQLGVMFLLVLFPPLVTAPLRWMTA